MTMGIRNKTRNTVISSNDCEFGSQRNVSIFQANDIAVYYLENNLCSCVSYYSVYVAHSLRVIT